MTSLFINIKELIQVRDKSVEKVSGKDMSILPTIKNLNNLNYNIEGPFPADTIFLKKSNN